LRRRHQQSALLGEHERDCVRLTGRRQFAASRDPDGIGVERPPIR
jgi:hypothetical protein